MGHMATLVDTRISAINLTYDFLPWIHDRHTRLLATFFCRTFNHFSAEFSQVVFLNHCKLALVGQHDFDAAKLKTDLLTRSDFIKKVYCDLSLEDRVFVSSIEEVNTYWLVNSYEPIRVQFPGKERYLVFNFTTLVTSTSTLAYETACDEVKVYYHVDHYPVAGLTLKVNRDLYRLRNQVKYVEYLPPSTRIYDNGTVI
jgi:hypothetical protein